jgi:hypothetical protein
LRHVVEVTGKQKKKNGQYSEGTMQWNPYGLHISLALPQALSTTPQNGACGALSATPQNDAITRQ